MVNERSERGLLDNLAVPGRLDFGIFVVASSTRRGLNHYLRVSYVPRGRQQVRGEGWSWSTGSCPQETAQAASVYAETLLLESLLHHYGVQDEIPY